MATSNKRLFVGNLSESLDEYSLIQFLSRHGKIAKFDYLFHKAGPKKGRPRGYAFVEYATPEEAVKTMLELNDKVLHGRKVSIKHANEAPDYSASGSSGPGAWRGSGPKATTLSTLKGHTKPSSRNAKISALEAKLAEMEAQNSSANASEDESASPGQASSSVSQTAASSRLPDNFPRKPNAEVVSTGIKEAKRHETEGDRKQGNSRSTSSRTQSGSTHGRSHTHGRHDRRHQQPPEPPKPATLASLGAGMGKS